MDSSGARPAGWIHSGAELFLYAAVCEGRGSETAHRSGVVRNFRDRIDPDSKKSRTVGFVFQEAAKRERDEGRNAGRRRLRLCRVGIGALARSIPGWRLHSIVSPFHFPTRTSLSGISLRWTRAPRLYLQEEASEKKA